MSAAATAIAGWVAETSIIDGVLFGSSDGEVEGPPVCAVAVAGPLRGYGKGHTQSQALASAVGEVLELYAAHARVDAQKLVHAPFEEIAQQAFDPRWLGLYSPDQYARPGFPYRPFSPSEPLHWVQGRWLDSDEAVYLPAFAVYLNDQFAGEALCQVTSNGLAAGASLEAAVEHAVLELHERDAFLRSWSELLPKRRIVSRDSEILKHLRTRGAETELYLLAEWPVCVAVAVAQGDGSQWPAFTLGLGAARDPDGAADKAILELGQTAPFFVRLWRSGEVAIPKTPADIKTLLDHGLYYCDPAHQPEFDRWRLTPERLMALDSREQRIAIAELSCRELSNSPYRVVRALGRGLLQISCCLGFERVTCGRNRAPCPIC